MKMKIPWLLLGLLVCSALYAADAVVYVTTLSTSYTHVGQTQTLSGLFYHTSGDSTWQFMARPNNRVYNMDLYRPEQGRVLAMATHTGVQQSWDSGQTWKTTTDWRMTEVSQICFSPDDSNTLYAASPYGFYKTCDNGITWTQHNQGLDNIDASFATGLVLDYSRPSTLFLSSEDGVYESSDAGEQWHRLNLEVRNIRTVVQNPQHPHILFIGSEDHGLYRSMDRGGHWQKCDTGILHQTFYTIAFNPIHPDTLYAAGFQTGVYKSVDGGKVWRQYFSGLEILDIHALAVDPNHSERIYAGSMGKGVFISTDAGKTWRQAGITGGMVWGIKIIK